MKLHLPTSLWAAILACISLAAPLAQTVSTGAFVGGVITCTLLAPQAQAAVADSYSDTLSLEGSTTEGTPTILYIYDGYTEDGSTVNGNYLGDDTTASSSLTLTTKDGFYQLSDAGTFDLTDVDITISAGTSSANAVNFCADSTGSSSYSFGTLDVAAGRVYLYFKCSDEAVETGYMSFETVTGQGFIDISLNHGTYSIDNENQGDFIVEFDHIEDYIGTISTRTGASWGGKFGGGTQLYINKVTVTTSGTTTTINGPYVYSENLTFYGAGKLAISILNYEGDTLGMVNEGTLSISSLVLSQDLTLDYSGSYTTTATISAFTANDYTITLDLTGVDIDNGFNLGISSSLSLDDFTLEGLSGTLGEDFYSYVDASNGCWAITTQTGSTYTSDATGELNISALVVKDADGVEQSFESVDSIIFTADLTLTLDEDFTASVITFGTEDSGIDMTLTGSGTLSAQELVIMDGTILSTDSRTFGSTTSWSGEGEMTMNLTSGHVYIDGAMDYAGTITVDGQGENRYLYIRTADLSTVNVDKFVMSNGADFVIGGNAGQVGSSATGADEAFLDITVVLSDYDSRLMTSSNYYYYQKIANLEIVDGGVLKNGTYAGYNSTGSYYYTTFGVGTITSSEGGSADAILSVETESGSTNVVVDLIEDLNATVTTTGIKDGKLTIGNITVGEGITTTIDCKVAADKAGSVAYSGSTLSMLNAGQLYIGCTSDGTSTGYLTLTKDLKLTYAGDTADLKLANVCLTGSKSVSLDLADLVLADGLTDFDLGLIFDGSVSLVNAEEGWTLTQDEDTYAWSMYYGEQGQEGTEKPGTVEINLPDDIVYITLYADYEYTDEEGEQVTGNFAGVGEAASQIDVINSNKAMVNFSGEVDTVISMESTTDSTVNNALLVGSTDGTSNVTFAGLVLSGENNNILWRDSTMTQVTWTFEEVTGEGSLDLGVSTAFDATTFENYKLIFNNVNDVNGTISNTLAREYWHAQAGGQIHISKVNASTGIETIFDGDIYSAGLSFTGAGSLSMSSLNYSGETLSMMNEGTLSITELVSDQKLTLDYGDGSGQLATVTFSGSAGLFLDLSSLTLEEMAAYMETGFDLGVSDYTGDITYSDLKDLSGWSVDESDWTMSYTDPDAPASNLVWGEDVESLTGDQYAEETIEFVEGTGNTGVEISGTVETAGLDISGDYTFSAESTEDSMVTGDLVVNSGTTTLKVDATATSTEVKEDGSMSVSDGTTLTSDSMSVEGTFTNSGETKITGALTAGDSSTITNSGTLTIGEGSELAELVNDGTANLGAGVMIDTVSGSASITLAGVENSITKYESTAGLNVADNVEVKIGSYNDTDLTVGSGATVSFTGDTTLDGVLSNAGTIDAANQSLVLNAATSEGGNITASSLTVAANTTLAAVTVNTLVLTAIGDKSVLDDASSIMLMSENSASTTQVLIVDSISSSSDKLVLDISSVIEAVLDDADNVATTYTLVDGTGTEALLDGLTIDDISLDKTSSDIIANHPNSEFLSVEVVYDEATNDLVLSFTPLDGFVLDLEDGTKSEISGDPISIYKEGTYELTDYSVLDNVVKVNVNADKTISLVGVAPEADDDYALLSNVLGTNTLTLLGDGAEQDRFLMEDGQSIETLAGLVVDNVSLTIGNGVSNITDVKLAAGASMDVADEATFNTSSLTTDAQSSFSGEVNLANGGTASLAGNLSGMDLVAASGASISTIGITASSLNSLNASKADITLGAAGLALGAESSISDSTISLTLNSADFDKDSTIVLFDASSLSMSDTTIVITDSNDDDNWQSLLGLSLVITSDEDNSGVIDYESIKIETVDGLLGEYITFEYVDGKYVAVTRQIDYVDMASTENGRAGLSLVMATVETVEDGGDLAKLVAAMEEYYDNGNYAAADKLGAAVAGATTTSLGSALMSDVGRQLGTIRNRTRAMGVNPNYINEDMPYYNAWVSAEGGSSDLDADGTAAGHKLSSVGGSVGVDIDINDKLSVGVAYSYLLGDLTADGADNADGDMDSMYGSVYARINNKRWTHSMVATFGAIDASLDRTVNIDNNNSYKTKGDTDGSAFGLMYEVGYTYAVDDESSTCIQPVFNISYVNSSMDGYTETGSKDAALIVGDQDNSYFSFGLGAVLETVVGEDMYNRASVLSGRLMFKADAGDRKSEADVSLVNNAGVSQTIAGAELGAVGVEMGLGITIPVTDDVGAIFADVSCELRSGMTEVSGSVGYRFSF